LAHLSSNPQPNFTQAAVAVAAAGRVGHKQAARWTGKKVRGGAPAKKVPTAAAAGAAWAAAADATVSGE